MKKLVLFILLLYGVSAVSQSLMPTHNFNGTVYYEIGGDWHLYNEIDQQFLAVSTNIISVKLPKGVTQSQIQNLEDNFDITFLRMVETGWADFNTNPPLETNILTKCANVQGASLVEEVELSTGGTLLAYPNDSLMNDFPQPITQWSIDAANVDEAWDITTCDTSVTLAIMDSGVDWWHLDFQQATNTTEVFWTNSGEDAWTNPNVPGGNGVDDDGNGLVDDWRGWNFLGSNNNVTDLAPGFPTGHGTGVAGIATARTNNTEGIAGVAGGWGGKVGAKTMIVKTTDTSVTSQANVDAGVDDAIMYAAKNGANVINISQRFHSNFSAIDDAIKLAYEKYNCIIVAGSGNAFTNNKPVAYPAKHPLVLGVAKTNINDKTLQSHTGPNLDLSAPGHAVPIMNGRRHFLSAPKYDINGGTSFASPMVAGTACLMYDINPCISSYEVADMLRHTADKVDEYDPQYNPSGYNYNHSDSMPGQALEMGYGRLNAKRAVQTAQSHKSSSLDLYIKDHYLDFGYLGSYPPSIRFDDWSGIWVRNQPDGRQNQKMEEIEYSVTDPAYVYVRVRNKSCQTSTSNETMTLNWTKAAMTTSWPLNWFGGISSGSIASITLPQLAPGEDTILQFQWDIEPEPLKNWGVCITARINSPTDSITHYDNNLAQEIRKNNNIAIRNLQVMNIYPGKKPPVVNGVERPYGIHMYTGNATENPAPVDIHLDVPENQEEGTLAEEAELHLYMSDGLWEVFNESAMGNHEGVVVAGEKHLIVEDDHAVLKDMSFNTGQRESMYFGVNFLVEEVDSVQYYRYHITQYQEDQILGSMNFNITRELRNPFAADAGPDQYIAEGETAILQAADIHESAEYLWSTPGGDVIHEGRTLNVSPEETQTYQLEVTADIDLYKDYDEATVHVYPYAITSVAPNPASSSCTVGYDAEEALTATLLVTNASNGHTVQNYALNTQEDEKILNISSLSAGNYVLVLLCDGQVVDSENLQIQ